MHCSYTCSYSTSGEGGAMTPSNAAYNSSSGVDDRPGVLTGGFQDGSSLMS